ncbi:MAG TPA: protein translocase subunit SecF [Microbacteriaceae bacterium]|nr:protein translocase subunit SecF [Microbacteriaceae bacterium]
MAKASALTRFGNDLYTGAKSFPFVQRRGWWYLIAGALLLIVVAGTLLRGGLVFGIEFSGGSQFRVSAVQDTSQRLAEDAVESIVPGATAHVTVVGTDTKSIQVQTETVSIEESDQIAAALAAAYEVPESQVSATFISGSWGQDVSRQGIIALVVFIVLAAIFMALYFRTWKMSLAALVSLAHDLVITIGVYGLFGFEITPSAVIGFLTILGYSLYDTVVVFDKVRENTKEDAADTVRTFPESVNLAVNQTLVRSINTGVVAVLPVAAILWIGALVLGAGTLRDIALALFIGIIVGTYSTIFVAAPFYSQLREGESGIRKHTQRVLAVRAKAKPVEAGATVE